MNTNYYINCIRIGFIRNNLGLKANIPQTMHQDF